MAASLAALPSTVIFSGTPCRRIALVRNRLAAGSSRCSVKRKSYEVFQSALDPAACVLLERWDDQAALDAHAQVNAARPTRRWLISTPTASDPAKTTSTTGRGSPMCAGSAR